MNKVDVRIEKIKNNREILLKMVRDSISEHKDNMMEEITNVIAVLNIEEESAKKYTAMVKAQELVASLTQEILEAKTTEDVLKIRKKLNYYINKIKAELTKRNIEQTTIDEYQEKTNYLRNDIAKYIRFLKREDNISEIENLYANYENLTVDEMKKLREALNRENSYNTRNIKPPKKKKAKSEVVIPCETEEIKSISETEFNDVSVSFEQSASAFYARYNIAETYDYHSGHFGKNIINFFRNIPHYMHNKKALKAIERDYRIFYAGSDLVSFMEYTKRRNSIRQGLKCIFDKTYLYSKEAFYLNCHDKCSWWLFDFCKKQSLELPIKYYKKNLEKAY